MSLKSNAKVAANEKAKIHIGPDHVQLIIFEIVSTKTNNLSYHLQLMIFYNALLV